MENGGKLFFVDVEILYQEPVVQLLESLCNSSYEVNLLIITYEIIFIIWSKKFMKSILKSYSLNVHKIPLGFY
jgi:hypothetical protein